MVFDPTAMPQSSLFPDFMLSNTRKGDSRASSVQLGKLAHIVQVTSAGAVNHLNLRARVNTAQITLYSAL